MYVIKKFAKLMIYRLIAKDIYVIMEYFIQKEQQNK